MLGASKVKIERSLDADALVLDVGGWANPFPRADWVIDVMPHESRGLYGEQGASGQERFDVRTWIQRDICSHDPWPFDDKQFDFAICSHTLEDVRDPIWVCHELNRVAKAGYIEVPSRLEEQAYGVHGPFVGWSHHHWLVDVDDLDGKAHLRFVFKPHAIHGGSEFSFPEGFAERLTDDERVQHCFWEAGFGYEEVLLFEPGALDRYLADFVRTRSTDAPARIAARKRLGRWRGERSR